MTEATGNRRTSMRATDKPFNIDKKLVYEAYKAVKSNGGAAGVDGQTIGAVRGRLEEQPLQDLEQDELRNLLSSAGTRRLHSQEVWRPKDFGGTHSSRSRGTDGG